MENYLKKYCRDSLVISVLLIILAIILIAKPDTILSVITIIIGIVLIISGLFNMISYFKTPNELKTFSVKLVIGIVSIVLGFILIFNSALVNTVFIYIVGAWMIIQSIMKLQVAFNIKGLSGNSNWVIVLILSIITLLLGIVILFNPFASLIAVTQLCGIMLLASELINLFESIYVLLKV